MSDIGNDLDRFKKILKNKVQTNLGKYITSDHIIGQQGNKIVNVPIQRIDLPRFMHGSAGGTGQGDGNEGDPIDGSQGKKPGKGKKAGQDAGEQDFIAEFTPDELAGMLGEELKLPKIEDKGKGKINSTTDKYNGIRSIGPEGLRHFKRTYKQALKRSIASGTYDSGNPIIVPIKDDKKFKAAKMIEEPDCNTVILYMMDVSGSVGDEQRKLIKSEIFWIDLWLKLQYKNIESRFIVHTSEAREVTKDEFFLVHDSGGTEISSAYNLCWSIMEEDYPFTDWNIYAYHFSDGENYGGDTDQCIKLMKESILPNCNSFCYGQVSSPFGEFLKAIGEAFKDNDKVAVSEVLSSQDIMTSIKTFLGKGK